MQMALGKICDMVKTDPIKEGVKTGGPMMLGFAFDWTQQLTMSQADRFCISTAPRCEHEDSSSLGGLERASKVWWAYCVRPRLAIMNGFNGLHFKACYPEEFWKKLFGGQNHRIFE